MTKAVFLDRDGVINLSLIKDGKPYAPRTIDEFKINADIKELSRLKKLGFQLIIVTNQPDVANGIVTRAFVDDLHARIQKAFPFDDIYACFHSDRDNCNCRKPKPGMLLEAHGKYGIDMANSYMIGDRWRDIVAGTSAGCASIFIDQGYKDDAPPFTPSFTCKTLMAAIDWIEKRETSRS